jgi:hypothetical protein
MMRFSFGYTSGGPALDRPKDSVRGHVRLDGLGVFNRDGVRNDTFLFVIASPAGAKLSPLLHVI